MNQIYVYGAGYFGEKLVKLASQYYTNEISIIGVIDREKTGLLLGHEIVKINSVPQDAIIVIAIVSTQIAVEIYRELFEKGYRNIWRYLGRQSVKEGFFEVQCLNCNGWKNGVLRHVEMHIMDSCNLNCRGCSHFSPIFQSEYPVFQERIGDVKKLKEKIGYIEGFYILGGEPFLNPDIGKYAVEIAGILPDTRIGIITNGILIPEVSSEILQMIYDSGATVIISEYLPTSKMMINITSKLEKFGIPYSIRKDMTKFNKPLSLSDHSSYERLCISNGCITIGNGMIARCPTLMFIDGFNKYFNTHLPADGKYSLYDDNTNLRGWALIDKMRDEVPLCMHCVKNEIEWSSCGKNPCLSDFTVES